MTKKAELLKDPDVARWHTNLSRGSPITANVYLRRVGLFCEQHDLNLKDLVDLGKKRRKKLEDLIEDYVTRIESEGKSPGYVAGILKSVKS